MEITLENSLKISQLLLSDSDLYVAYYSIGILEIPIEIKSDYKSDAYLGKLLIENLSSKKYLKNVIIRIPKSSVKYKPLIYNVENQIVTEQYYDEKANTITISRMKYREKLYISLFMDNRVSETDFEIEYNDRLVTSFNRKISNLRKYTSLKMFLMYAVLLVIMAAEVYMMYESFQNRQKDSAVMNILKDNGAYGCVPYLYDFHDDYALEHEVSQNKEVMNIVFYYNHVHTMAELEQKARLNTKVLLCRLLK